MSPFLSFQLNKNSVLHHDGRLAFTAHWDFIAKLAKRNNIEIVIFENLSKLLKSIELEKNISLVRKSIVAAKDLSAGTVLEMIHFAFKKPGDGIEAKEYKNLLGKELVRSVSYNQKLKIEDLK